MPTGPWIVMVLSIVAILAFVFAPKKGMLRRFLNRRNHQMKVQQENLLKLFYSMEENTAEREFTRPRLLRSRRFQGRELEDVLQKLKRSDLVAENQKMYSLTDEGRHEATRVVRLHRLWELYLNERMNIAPDHVHHDAEAIEHIISPELEKELLKELDYPNRDPHQSEIPGIEKVRG
jgi:manganese/zinc/iron transport system permease protein